MKSYGEQLRSPKWQRLRLEVMSNAGFACQGCGNSESTLNVHHVQYRKNAMAWEYEISELKCLCEDCHFREHEDEREESQALEELRNEIGQTLDGMCLQALEAVSDFIARNPKTQSECDAANDAASAVAEPLTPRPKS